MDLCFMGVEGRKPPKTLTVLEDDTGQLYFSYLKVKIHTLNLALYV